jgi:hypothetical protein
MTVLGAVVFGGFLVLGVLWLLFTAPDSDVDQAWDQVPGAISAPEDSLVSTNSSSN